MIVYTICILHCPSIEILFEATHHTNYFPSFYPSFHLKTQLIMAIIPSLPLPPRLRSTNRSANHTPHHTLQDQRSAEAFLLALLTAGGGLTGYFRTGSIPSVIAGTGVGALVCLPFPFHSYSSPPPGKRGFSPNPPSFNCLIVIHCKIRSTPLVGIASASVNPMAPK